MHRPSARHHSSPPDDDTPHPPGWPDLCPLDSAQSRRAARAIAAEKVSGGSLNTEHFAYNQASNLGAGGDDERKRATARAR